MPPCIGSTKARRSQPIEAAFPGTTADGKVDRVKLGERVIGHRGRDSRGSSGSCIRWSPQCATHSSPRPSRGGAKVAVLDIPLLYETGGETLCDAVVVVSAPAEMQRERVLARPGMTEAKFAAILAKQMPDADKRARADFVVDTSQGFDAARAQVRDILAQVAKMANRKR